MSFGHIEEHPLHSGNIEQKYSTFAGHCDTVIQSLLIRKLRDVLNRKFTDLHLQDSNYYQLTQENGVQTILIDTIKEILNTTNIPTIKPFEKNVPHKFLIANIKGLLGNSSSMSGLLFLALCFPNNQNSPLDDE